MKYLVYNMYRTGLKVVKMYDKNKVIGQIRDYFDDKDSIGAVYLFGSIITEYFNYKSDIDLAILLDPEITKLDAFDIKLEVAADLEDILKKDIDIVIFNTAPVKLRHQILKGKLIVEKDKGLRIEEEVKTIRDYLDMKYIYDTYEEKIGKVILDG
jgi:uncharacterized protein